MAIRIHCEDETTAEEYAELLRTGGYAAEVTLEPAVDRDEPEPVVTTDAPTEAVAELVEGSNAVVEVSDPMSGTSAAVPAEELASDDPADDAS
ncbi:hypothetical protein HJ590_04460 [Naumannella sp. ID2617S]|nr:hypothetical protein [Naumannella sp. ID2617S]